MSDLTHLQRIRQEMPATTANVYLNTGTFGPLPTCVMQAIQEHIQGDWQNGRLGAQAFEQIFTIYKDARQNVARLLNASPQEIALTDSTGDGMNIVSYGIDWREGDEVITTDHEHISALAPLYQIRDRYSITIRVAELGPSADRPLLEAISSLITPRTRLISLSHVTWTTGTTLDIRAIGQLGRQQDIPVLIDGAQSAGSIPIDVKALDVDFYAIPMQKWLCGPDGTGALYARKESFHYLSPTYVGYWSAQDVHGDIWAVHEDAQRFEAGGRQTAAIKGQAAVLHWLDEFVGYDWLFKRISDLHIYAFKLLLDLPGINMLTPVPGDSGLIAFTLTDRDSAALTKELRDKYNIHIRDIPETGSLRVSTGFYNTEEDIDKLIQAIRSFE